MMDVLERFTATSLSEEFYWFNEPQEVRLGDGLRILTKEKTDFWQNTHYGFRRDDGHCCFVRLPGDFSIVTHVSFQPQAQYDQCGLMIRADSENWIKVSTEFEDEQVSRLGSVVTNLAYSDWATQDIPSSQREMWYRIRKCGPDFLIEHAADGQEWQQMRVTHLHQLGTELEVGLYACSPIGTGFWSHFRRIEISDNDWLPNGE